MVYPGALEKFITYYGGDAAERGAGRKGSVRICTVTRGGEEMYSPREDPPAVDAED